MLILRLIRKMIVVTAGFLAGTILLLFSIWFFLAVYNRYHDYRRCVGLPNGVILGYEALFDHRMIFDKSRWSSDSRIILKHADGSPLIVDDVFPIFITKTTVYGQAAPMGTRRKGYVFAYRPDVGLVYKYDDPETYARLEAEAGPMLNHLFDDFMRDEVWESRIVSYSEDGKYLITDSGRFPLVESERHFVHMGLPLAHDLFRKDPSFLRRDCNVSVFPR